MKILFDGPKNSPLLIVLTHGATTPMDTPFMNFFALGLAKHGLRVARFEFPYMAKQRISGNKTPPNSTSILLETWHEILSKLRSKSLIIGGKSMGGRIASMIADESGVSGLVCLGYPFHPPGKPEKVRIKHLANLDTPALFLQGDRDPLGNKIEVADYPISPNIHLHWLPDGDHSFKPRKKSGFTEQQNWNNALETIILFTDRPELR